MDENQVISKLASYGLPNLQKIKAAADPSDPDMRLLDAAIATFKTKTIPPTGERAKKLESDIEQGMLKPKSALRRAAESVWETGPASVGRQIIGDVSAVASSIPALVPAVEAAGDLSHELLRGHPTAQKVSSYLLPTSGSTNAAIENTEVPSLTRAVGVLTPMASMTRGVGAAPGVVSRLTQRVMPGMALKAAETTGEGINTAMAPANALYRGIQGQAARAGLGPITSNLVAGAGTSLPIAATEAGLRRVAPALTGEGVPPVDLENEILNPTIVGTVGSLPLGVRGSVTHEGYPGMKLPPGSPDSKGASTARTFVKTRLSGRETNPEDILFARPKGEAGVEEVSKEAGRRHAATAAEVEPQVRKTLSRQDQSAREEFSNAIKPLEGNIITRTGANGKDLYENMDALISSKAKHATAGKTTLDEEGRPVSREQFLSAGRHLKNLWGQIKDYIDLGTVRDYRNAIADLNVVAERGTPEQSWVARQLVKGLKQHLRESDPRIAEAYANYRVQRKNTDRAREIAYGEEDPSKLGQSTGDPEDPYIDILPSQETAARKRLMDIGSGSEADLARTPATEELEAQGLSTHIGKMRQSREAMQSDIEAKHAIEMSRFPSTLEMLHPAAQFMAAATSHVPTHAGPVMGMAGASAGRRAGQWARSGLALKLRGVAPGLPIGLASQAATDSGDSMQLSVPSLAVFSQLVGDARQRAASLVDSARQHAKLREPMTR